MYRKYLCNVESTKKWVIGSLAIRDSSLPTCPGEKEHASSVKGRGPA